MVRFELRNKKDNTVTPVANLTISNDDWETYLFCLIVASDKGAAMLNQLLSDPGSHRTRNNHPDNFLDGYCTVCALPFLSDAGREVLAELDFVTVEEPRKNPVTNLEEIEIIINDFAASIYLKDHTCAQILRMANMPFATHILNDYDVGIVYDATSQITPKLEDTFKTSPTLKKFHFEFLRVLAECEVCENLAIIPEE